LGRCRRFMNQHDRLSALAVIVQFGGWTD